MAYVVSQRFQPSFTKMSMGTIPTITYTALSDILHQAHDVRNALRRYGPEFMPQFTAITWNIRMWIERFSGEVGFGPTQLLGGYSAYRSLWIWVP